MVEGNYNDELRRVVTVCAGTESTRHYYTPQQGQALLALIFCDRKRNLTRDEQIALMFHDNVRELFGNFYYGTTVSLALRSCWYEHTRTRHDEHYTEAFYIVSGSQGLYVLEDKCDKPLFLLRDNLLFETTANDTYNRCLRIQKFLGEGDNRCRCAWNRDRCIHTWHALEVVAKRNTNDPQTRFAFMDTAMAFQPDDEWIERNIHLFDQSDWIDYKKRHRVKNWQSILAGYTVIPPTATAANPLNPNNTTVRLAHRCNFADLEFVRSSFSARARAGVKTRQTINKECRHCYFGGAYRNLRGTKSVFKCNPWNPRYCKHGAWTEERLVDYTLERYAAALKQQGSPLSLQDVWVVAQFAGIPFPIKNTQTKRKCAWQVCRIYESGGVIYVEVDRTARNARGKTPLMFTSIKKLREFLPDKMQAFMNQIAQKPIDRKLLALWIHASIMKTGQSYVCYIGDGGFGTHQRHVGAVWLTGSPPTCVRVELYNTRSEEYEDFSTLNSLFGYVKDSLTLFNVTHIESDEYIPTLHYWTH